MIKVLLSKQSNYPVKTPKVKRALQEFLLKKGESDSSVSVAIVSEKTMIKLAKKHLGEKHMVHNVLSFTDAEARGEFVDLGEHNKFLGEIVVCYKKAVDEANRDNMLLDLKIIQLVEHGALHLLGKHHD